MNRIVVLFLVFFLCVPAFAGAEAPREQVLDTLHEASELQLNTLTIPPTNRPTSDELEYRTGLALKNSQEAGAAVARLAAEMEKRGSHDPSLLTRLETLEGEFQKGVTTAAAVADLEEDLKELRRVLNGSRSGIQDIAEQVSVLDGKLDATQSGFATLSRNMLVLTNTPKADGVARLMAIGSAITFAVLTIIIGYFVWSHTKKSQQEAKQVQKTMSMVQSTQDSHSNQLNQQEEHIARLNRKTELLKDIEIPADLIPALEGLEGGSTHRCVIRVDTVKYVLVFRLSPDERRMYRVDGIRGQHNSVSMKNMRSVILRAARDDRLEVEEETDPEEDWDSKIVQISQPKVA